MSAKQKEGKDIVRTLITEVMVSIYIFPKKMVRSDSTSL
jgi:hypothetical protein